MSVRMLPAVLPALLSAAATAQSPVVVPPGFALQSLVTERSQPSQVRGAAFDPASGEHWLGLGSTVFHRPDPWTWNTVHQFTAPEDLGLLKCAGGRIVWFTALHAGTAFRLDPAGGAMTSFAGVPNAFDLAVGPAGEVLLSANPNWPAPGADTGLWHVGPGRTPREVLRLRGPSGPLTFDPDGNLLVAELGPVVPVPPGGARILRFPRARWQAALATTTVLTPADADAIGTGWNGAYALCCDDRGRLHVTDPGTMVVERTLPFSLQRDPVAACGLPFAGLQLQFVPGNGAPFLPFQPEALAGAMLVGSGDFVSEWTLHALRPRRPDFDVLPGPVFGAGLPTFRLRGGPAGGIAFLAASADAPRAEWLAAVPDGTPLWLGLDPYAPIATAAFALDGTGNGQVQVRHPGGFALQVQFQALALGAAGSGRHGTSGLLPVQLLP